MSEMEATGNTNTVETSGVTPSVEVNHDVTPASEPPVKQEKLFKQQEVADLLSRERKEAVARYKRQQEQSNLLLEKPPSSPYQTDDVRRIAAEEAQRLMESSQVEAQRKAQMDQAERMASDFFTKLQTVKDKYSDFNDVVGSVKDWGKLATAVGLANMVDNTGDVMYDMLKNPTKIANIQQLAAISPDLAFSEMRKYSEVIKTNETAQNTKLPNEPLSQLRASNTGTDTGKMGVSDYRRKYGPNYRWR